MSTYYEKYLKYKKKYLEIQTKINHIKNTQSGGFLFFKNESKPEIKRDIKPEIKPDPKNNKPINNLEQFILPHHKYLINNPNILYDNEKREQYLLKSYINNQLDNLL